jgi:hypothetical protein
MDLAFENPKSKEPAESQDDLLGMGGGGESQAPSSNTPISEASVDPFDIFGAPPQAVAPASSGSDPFDIFGGAPAPVSTTAPTAASSDPFDDFGDLEAVAPSTIPDAFSETLDAPDSNGLPVPSLSEIPNPSEPADSSIPAVNAIPQQAALGDDPTNHSQQQPAPSVDAIPEQSQPDDPSAQPKPSVDEIPEQSTSIKEEQPAPPVDAIPDQSQASDAANTPPAPLVDEIPPQRVDTTPSEGLTETAISEQEEVVETEEMPAESDPQSTDSHLDPFADAILKEPLGQDGGDKSTAGPQPSVDEIPQQQSRLDGNTAVDTSVDGIPQQPSKLGNGSAETPPESLVGAIPHQTGVGETETPISEQVVETEQPTAAFQMDPSVDAIPDQSQSGDSSQPDPSVDGIPEQSTPGEYAAGTPPESLVGVIPDQTGSGDATDAPPTPMVGEIPEQSAAVPFESKSTPIPEQTETETNGGPVGVAILPEAENPGGDLHPSVDAIPEQSLQYDVSCPEPTVDGIPEQSKPEDNLVEAPPESLVGAIPDQAATADATDTPPTPIVGEIPEQSAAAPFESTGTPIPEQTETENRNGPVGAAVLPEAENPGGARAIPDPMVVAVVGNDNVLNPTQEVPADQSTESTEPSMPSTPARPAAIEAVMSVPSTPDPAKAPDNSPDTPLPGSVDLLQKELHAAHMKIMHLQERHAQEDEGPTLAVLEEFQNNLQLQMSQKAEAEVAARRANAQVKEMEDGMDAFREEMESRCEGLNKDLLKAVEAESIMELELKKAREERDEEQRKQIALTNRLNSAKKKEFTKSNITEHYEEQVENLKKLVEECNDKFAAETTEKERLAKELADWKQYSDKRIQSLEKAVNDEKKLNEERKRKMKGFVEAKAEEIRSAKADNMSLQTELDQTNKSLLELNQRFKQLHEQWIQSQTRNRELQRDMNKMKMDSEKMHKVGDSLEMKLSRSALVTEEHKNKRLTAKNELMAVLKQLETERNLTNRLQDSIKFTFTPKALSQQQIIQETLQEFESELERLATRLGRPLPPPPVTGNELFIEMMSEQTLEEPGESENQDGEGSDRPNPSETTSTRMLSKLESETQRLSQCIMALQTSVERMHGVLDGSGTRNCVSALQDMFLAGNSSQTASSEERTAITGTRRVAGTRYGQVPNTQIT